MNAHPLIRKYLRTYPMWRFRPPQIQVTGNLQRLGSDYGGYHVDMSLIPAVPVIYSLGVGEDISFDLSLIEHHGFDIYAFDPTPKVSSWIHSQKLPAHFRFEPLGIANFDGEATFYLPPRPDFVSHSLLRAKQFSSDSLRVPVAKLSTLMKRFGHTRIDLLKMDIEGAEYDVLTDLIKDRVDVAQLVIEFHHRFSNIGIPKTQAILKDLHVYGMRLSHVCPRTEIMTLVRPQLALPS